MMKHEVKWRGEKYSISELTDQLKAKYCRWLYGAMLTNARQFKPAAQYLEFDRKLTAAPPEWTSVPSPEVLESFKTEAGLRALLRVLMDLSEDPTDKNYLSDADLMDLINEKNADDNSDLNTAIRLVREAADPKAQRGGRSSPAPADASEPTPSSVTSPSTSVESGSAA